MTDDLLPTLMLLFDGKDTRTVCDTILTYLSGNEPSLLYMQRKLDDELQATVLMSYSVGELYDDITERNDDHYSCDPMEIVCSDEIALNYIRDMSGYRRMEYAYDTFHETKDIMIEEMIKDGHIIPASLIDERNANPYWGG